MELPMTGRVAIITGGASGLGRATAQRLAADGLTVVVADLDAEKSQHVASELPGTGHLGVALDVADEAAVRQVFDTTETALGPVAVLACYAGIGSVTGGRGRRSILDTSVEEWNGVARVNTVGTFICVREMMRRRVERPAEHSRIILIASMAGQVGGIASGAAYSASKAAVLVLAKVAAREALPIHMTVNAIAPGPIDTPLLRASIIGGGENDDFSATTWAELPLGRLGRVEEIAAAASYLVSEEADYVTGATIDVNGGMNMR
jgi:3-oxoacyl-[acyl-carrier protein] reductase